MYGEIRHNRTMSWDKFFSRIRKELDASGNEEVVVDIPMTLSVPARDADYIEWLLEHHTGEFGNVGMNLDDPEQGYGESGIALYVGFRNQLPALGQESISGEGIDGSMPYDTTRMELALTGKANDKE